jgi:hypothetical protein
VIALSLRTRQGLWFQRRLDGFDVFPDPTSKLVFLHRPIGKGAHDGNASGLVCHQVESVQIQEGFRDNQSCPLVTVNERVVFSYPMAVGGGEPITSAI